MIAVATSSEKLSQGVLRHLLAYGADPARVIAVAQRPEPLTPWAERGVQVRRADEQDSVSMTHAFEGAGTLVLISASAPMVRRIHAHNQALEAAASAGVRRVILVSIVTARPDSHALEAPFALYAESAVRLSGMDWLILRAGLDLDTVASTAPALATVGQLAYPIAQGRVSYVARDDVARGIAAAALSPGVKNEVLELTGPMAISMPELAGYLTEATGQPIRFEAESDSELFEHSPEARDAGPLERRALIARCRAIEAGEYARATDHVERLTGTPAPSARDYLMTALSELRNQLATRLDRRLISTP